ncbi:MAG: hypothetical protein EXS47_01795 [Candidatus Zambryskibacteria bacterium]|nr:hypothetical protein [Candidatus Zambryskibacteria bacterium]
MEQNKSGIGSIIGIVVIISIIILGGLYFWGKRIEESKLRESMASGEVQLKINEQNETATIRSLSSSNDLGSIEADLNATNFENMNTELK